MKGWQGWVIYLQLVFYVYAWPEVNNLWKHAENRSINSSVAIVRCLCRVRSQLDNTYYAESVENMQLIYPTSLDLEWSVPQIVSYQCTDMVYHILGKFVVETELATCLRLQWCQDSFQEEVPILVIASNNTSYRMRKMMYLHNSSLEVGRFCWVSKDCIYPVLNNNSINWELRNIQSNAGSISSQQQGQAVNPQLHFSGIYIPVNDSVIASLCNERLLWSSNTSRYNSDHWGWNCSYPWRNLFCLWQGIDCHSSDSHVVATPPWYIQENGVVCPNLAGSALHTIQFINTLETITPFIPDDCFVSTSTLSNILLFNVGMEVGANITGVIQNLVLISDDQSVSKRILWQLHGDLFTCLSTLIIIGGDIQLIEFLPTSLTSLILVNTVLNGKLPRFSTHNEHRCGSASTIPFANSLEFGVGLSHVLIVTQNLSVEYLPWQKSSSIPLTETVQLVNLSHNSLRFSERERVFGLISENTLVFDVSNNVQLLADTTWKTTLSDLQYLSKPNFLSLRHVDLSRTGLNGEFQVECGMLIRVVPFLCNLNLGFNFLEPAVQPLVHYSHDVLVHRLNMGVDAEGETRAFAQCLLTQLLPHLALNAVTGSSVWVPKGLQMIAHPMCQSVQQLQIHQNPTLYGLIEPEYWRHKNLRLLPQPRGAWCSNNRSQLTHTLCSDVKWVAFKPRRILIYKDMQSNRLHEFPNTITVFTNNSRYPDGTPRSALCSWIVDTKYSWGISFGGREQAGPVTPNSINNNNFRPVKVTQQTLECGLEHVVHPPIGKSLFAWLTVLTFKNEHQHEDDGFSDLSNIPFQFLGASQTVSISLETGCLSGMFAHDMSTQCVDCAPGFSNSNGSFGFRLNQSQTAPFGFKQCSECDVGYFSKNTQSVSCTACTPGTYAPLKQMTTCLSCGAGNFSNDLVHCQACSPGKFSTNIVNEKCLDCAVGFAQPQHQGKTCFTCATGAYSSIDGTSNCSICPNGTTTIVPVATSINDCVCKRGWFYSWPQSKCVVCMTGASCERGEFERPLPLDGFWTDPTKNISKENEIMVLCIPFEACKRQPDSFQQCAKGYTGNACGECESKTYYRLGDLCHKCSQVDFTVQNIFFVVMILILIICIICVVLRFLSIPNQLRINSVGITLYALQLIAVFYALPMKWPPNSHTMFTAISVTNINLQFIAPSCAAPAQDYVYWSQWMLTLAIPWIIIATLWLFYISILYIEPFGQWVWAFISCYRDLTFIRNQGSSDKWFNRFIYASVSVCSFSYTFLLKTTCEPLNCIERLDKKWVMRHAPSIFCYEPAWETRLPLVILNLILYLVVCPLLLIWILFYYKVQDKRCVDFLEKFGRLTIPYRTNFYWWELIIILRKAIFVVIIDFSFNQIYVSDPENMTGNTVPKYLSASMGLITLFFVSLICSILFQPFRHSWCNYLDTCWNSCMLLLACGIPIIQNQNAEPYVLFIVVIIIILVFIVTPFSCWQEYKLVVFAKNAMAMNQKETYSDQINEWLKECIDLLGTDCGEKFYQNVLLTLPEPNRTHVMQRLTSIQRSKNDDDEIDSIAAQRYSSTGMYAAMSTNQLHTTSESKHDSHCVSTIELGAIGSLSTSELTTDNQGCNQLP